MKHAAALMTIALAACSVAKPVHAEPSSSVRYLIAEPVSLLDFGMKALGDDLEGGDRKASVMVEYLWSENRIRITLTDVLTRPALKDAKDRCAVLISGVRARLGIIDGKSAFGVSGMEAFFTHYGYESKSEPKNLGPDLDAITIIRGRLGLSGGKAIGCEGPLVSDKVMYSE